MKFPGDVLCYAVVKGRDVVHKVYKGPDMSWFWQASECGLMAIRLRRVRSPRPYRKCRRCFSEKKT